MSGSLLREECPGRCLIIVFVSHPQMEIPHALNLPAIPNGRCPRLRLGQRVENEQFNTSGRVIGTFSVDDPRCDWYLIQGKESEQATFVHREWLMPKSSGEKWRRKRYITPLR